jgi:hypothetical protein
VPRLVSGVCAIKTVTSSQSLGDRLFPSSLGFEDKLHYFPRGAFSAPAIRDVVADFF